MLIFVVINIVSSCRMITCSIYLSVKEIVALYTGWSLNLSISSVKMLFHIPLEHHWFHLQWWNIHGSCWSFPPSREGHLGVADGANALFPFPWGFNSFAFWGDEILQIPLLDQHITVPYKNMAIVDVVTPSPMVAAVDIVIFIHGGSILSGRGRCRYISYFTPYPSTPLIFL